MQQHPQQCYVPPAPPYAGPPRSRAWIWVLAIGIPCLILLVCCGFGVFVWTRAVRTMTSYTGPPAMGAAGAAPTRGLEQAWTLPAAEGGAAMDRATGTVYVLKSTGDCVRAGPDGHVQGTLRFGTGDDSLLSANLLPGEGTEFVAFSRWGGDVSAVTAAGAPLWTYPRGDGVDDVWVQDLDGDGLDEAIIGYNGSTGLHVVDTDGRRIWSTTEVGNVWHVCAADMTGDGKPEVISTSSKGDVSVFDAASGRPLIGPSSGIYAYLVRPVLNASRPGTDTRIVVGGTQHSMAAGTEAVVGIGASGRTTWEVDLAGDGADDGASCRSRPWVAVTTRGGSLYVIDGSNGMVLASAGGLGRASAVTWFEWSGGTEPLLAVSTHGGLQVYRVQGAEPAPASAK